MRPFLLLCATLACSSETAPFPPGGSGGGGQGGTTEGCDEDQDGLNGEWCGGRDCCDGDPAVPMKAGDPLPSEPTECGDWDHNCDGVIDPEFSGPVTCEWVDSVCGPFGGDLPGWQGQETECGDERLLITDCIADNTGTCVPVTEMAIQRCR